MSDNLAKAVLVLCAGGALVVGLLVWRPGYLSSSDGLKMLLGLELLLVAISNYRRAYFPVLIVSFLWAGSAFPMHSEFLQVRWVVLAVGGVTGIAIYMKDRAHSFNVFHLIAFFCVLTAFVSGTTSAYPNEALLKTLSLLLLFMYMSAGVRTALPSLNPEQFFQMLLWGGEAVTWGSVVLYFVVHLKVFGNSNSLGAVMGIAVVPLLLWGRLTAQSGPRRLRLNVELVLAIVMLLSSYSRAAIGAAAISCLVVCTSARQYRLLAKGIALVVVLAVGVVALMPGTEDPSAANRSDSVVKTYLYKGKEAQGLFGSRKGPWEQTWSVIREKPWFGSGFGTSAVTQDMTKLQYAARHVDTWVIREHGNSYLAILEWTGLLGVLPFYCLAIAVAVNAGRVFYWLRRSQDVFSPAIPAAAIVIAGLVNAAFEDWLFAVGYYICVFFWANAFVLADVMPREVEVYSAQTDTPVSDPCYAGVA